MTDKAFVLRLGERLEESLKEGVIGTGWAEARGVDKTNDWTEFKNLLKNAYPLEYSDSPRALGNAAGSLFTFIHEISKGDLVVIPCADGLYVCRVESEGADYDEAAVYRDYAWRRKATFITTSPIARNVANNDLQKRLKVRQTCVTATDLFEEISSVISRKNKITFKASVFDAAQNSVSDALIRLINDRELEELIRRLALASGAEAVILGRNQKSEGDIDILATYDLGIAQEEATVKVAYQVKQHQGITDTWAIEQLTKILEDHEQSYDKGCVVTTAENFSEAAKTLADKNNIILIARTQLVEWILNVGLEKLDI